MTNIIAALAKLKAKPSITLALWVRLVSGYLIDPFAFVTLDGSFFMLRSDTNID